MEADLLKEKLWLMDVCSLFKDDQCSSKQQKKLFEILCQFPQYFTIHEPVQKGTDYVYTIDIHLGL